MMIRFARAFFQALRLTLRGEAPRPAHFRPLEGWIATGLSLETNVRAAAQAERLDLAALQLKLDGRPTSLESSLAMLRHSLVNEYPRLMRLDDPYSMMVVQSSNLNDQYRVSQFLAAEALRSPALRRALAALAAHLSHLPEIERSPPD